MLRCCYAVNFWNCQCFELFSQVSKHFMLKAFNATRLPAVQWIIKLDPRGVDDNIYRCKQVTAIELLIFYVHI